MALEALGLVRWKSGVVEDTILVWLTDLGADQVLSDSYVPRHGLHDPAGVLLAAALLRQSDELVNAGEPIPASRFLRRLAERPDLIRAAMATRAVQVATDKQ